MGVQVEKLKILIVEDDEISHLLLNFILAKISREILHAENGIEAVEICRNNADIDLIMMDINIPLLDGFEATRQIRQFNQNSIIIAQTAYGLDSGRKKAIEAECNEYLSKPIIKNELMSLLQQYFVQ